MTSSMRPKEAISKIQPINVTFWRSVHNEKMIPDKSKTRSKKIIIKSIDPDETSNYSTIKKKKVAIRY